MIFMLSNHISFQEVFKVYIEALEFIVINEMVLGVGGSSSPASYDVVVHFSENYFSVIIMSICDICMYVYTQACVQLQNPLFGIFFSRCLVNIMNTAKKLCGQDPLTVAYFHIQDMAIYVHKILRYQWFCLFCSAIAVRPEILKFLFIVFFVNLVMLLSYVHSKLIYKFAIQLIFSSVDLSYIFQ